jgi:hypothetical protein
MNINQFKNGGQDFEPLDAGTYAAVCVGVIDIGTHTTTWEGKAITRDQLILMFDLPTETIEINGEQKPRCLSLTLTKSMSDKSNMRKHLRSWRGRDFTEIELEDFALLKLLGAPANVGVVQTKKEGKTYANISTIGKAMKGTEQKATRKIYFDLADPDTYGAIEALPDWIVTLINKSAESILTKKVFMKESTKAQVAQMRTESVDAGDDVAF